MSLSLPAIVGMVFIGLYPFVDAIYAGQLIGVDAMGAVSIAYPFTFINSGLAAMIGMGSASVLSRAIGARDQKRSEERRVGKSVDLGGRSIIKKKTQQKKEKKKEKKKNKKQ